jgi:hypothetical protein
MNIKKIIKVFGVIFAGIGLYHLGLSLAALAYRFLTSHSLTLTHDSGTAAFGVSALFVIKVVFYALMFLSGVELFRLRRRGVWLLYICMLLTVADGFFVGYYYDTYSMLVGSNYTLIGKALIIFYVFCKKIAMPLLVLVVFQSPAVTRALDSEI